LSVPRLHHIRHPTRRSQGPPECQHLRSESPALQAARAHTVTEAHTQAAIKWCQSDSTRSADSDSTLRDSEAMPVLPTRT
jgi:hypothetical protein